ncbi:MAG: hypothetical protein IPI03_11505 [Rubrivivax sp.]|jgi:hypothetical protein|nr:hypothetical protein [Rubrivivax sp.]MBK7262443.1 hypothetical protein [Rubrivivax sp.]MBK8528677.1 hypothetical protein [Rubrivivax sp.]
MVEAVKARTSAAVALLGRSVNINSGTLNPDGFSEFVAQNLPGSTATISFAEAYPPMPGSTGNQALQQLYSQISIDLGLGRGKRLTRRRAAPAISRFRRPMSTDSMARARRAAARTLRSSPCFRLRSTQCDRRRHSDPSPDALMTGLRPGVR